MKTFGIAMIMRNAEETLDMCLRSLSGCYDQLVIVDTGSDDHSISIAKSYGADVYEHTWEYDFAKARNQSFSYLHTDWACWIDCDDILVGKENIPELLSKLDENELDGAILEYFYSFDPVGIQLLSGMEEGIIVGDVSSEQAFKQLKARCNTTQLRERIVRRSLPWQWAYPVHEALPVIGRRFGKYDLVKMVHRRHVRGRSNHTERNINILDRIPVEQRDERIWFYYGLEYASLGHVDKSIHGFEQYLSLSTIEDERYLANHYLADLYRSKEIHDRAIRYDLDAVALRPTWRDAYAGLLASYVKKRAWTQAIYYGAMCAKAEIPQTPFAYNPLLEEVGWVNDYVVALTENGLMAEAREQLTRALQITPEDQSFQHNLDLVSIALNMSSGAENIGNCLEFFLRHDDAETAAMLVGRIPKGMTEHSSIKSWIPVIGAACGPASRGDIPPDSMKPNPTQVMDPSVIGRAWWNDIRMQHLSEVLAQRQHYQTILQVGGPIENQRAYVDMGLCVSRVSNLSQIVGQYDAVVLWSALERVSRPSLLVSHALAAVAPGGEVFAYVPNGPASKGLGPPTVGAARLRAYSTDSFRQVMGTIKMPHIISGWAAEAGDMFLGVSKCLPRGRSRTISIVCPVSPEPWGPYSLEKGIGGSEEAVIRLSRAFSRRGHVVTVYGSGWTGVDSGEWPRENGVSEPHYRPLHMYTTSNIVIGWRYPEIFYSFERKFDGEWKALWLHDSIERERVEKALPYIDKVWTISNYHASLYDGLEKVYIGRNGIDPWEVPVGVERNPKKLVYISTPFRGLGALLVDYFPKIRDKIPATELHCYYGWESSDKLGATSTPEGKAFKEQIIELCKQPGVVWHGRVGQPELYREVASAGVLAYPALHKEESCIAAMLAQACGAWPVVSPVGALPQTAVFGWKVQPHEFVDAVIDAVHMEQGREEMMAWTQKHLSWDDVASDWERLWRGLY